MNGFGIREAIKHTLRSNSSLQDPCDQIVGDWIGTVRLDSSLRLCSTNASLSAFLTLFSSSASNLPGTQPDSVGNDRQDSFVNSSRKRVRNEEVKEPNAGASFMT